MVPDLTPRGFGTTAMYEKITSATGSYGHGATVSVPGEQWVGVVATFKGVIPN